MAIHHDRRSPGRDVNNLNAAVQGGTALRGLGSIEALTEGGFRRGARTRMRNNAGWPLEQAHPPGPRWTSPGQGQSTIARAC